MISQSKVKYNIEKSYVFIMTQCHRQGDDLRHASVPVLLNITSEILTNPLKDPSSEAGVRCDLDVAITSLEK